MGLNLGIARDMSIAEFRAQSDAAWKAAFAEVRNHRGTGPGVPAGRVNNYARKNLVAAVFVRLEDRPHRGTMLASCDGSDKRAFSIPVKKLIIEPETQGALILAGIPRALCSWVNTTFPASRLGWPYGPDLTCEWGDDQRAAFAALARVAELTNLFVDKTRKFTPPSRKILLNRNEVA